MSAWIELSLDNLRNNIKVVQKKVGSNVKIMAVLKADGYGHGGAKIAEFCLKHGINQFAVAFVQEGVELRKQGVKGSILVLGSILPEEVDLIINYSLTPAVFSASLANNLEAAGRRCGEKIKCHVRIDVGASGLGVSADKSISFIEKIMKMEWLKVEGIFTHLPSAYGRDKELTKKDLEIFEGILATLKDRGIIIPLVHAVSSPGVMKNSHAYYDMVRPGTCLYGLPSFENQEDWGLKPVMQLKARIVDIKELDHGQRLGYDQKYQTKTQTNLASVSFGYAEGLFMFFLTKGNVLVCGKRAPIIGKSFMSHFLVDVTHIPEAKIGDEVVIIGMQGGKVITAEEVAYKAKIGTTNCEIVCLLSKMIPRVYLEKGSQAHIPVCQNQQKGAD